MGGRMHRTLVLLIGLVMALVAAAVVLPPPALWPSAMPDARAAPVEPVVAVPLRFRPPVERADRPTFRAPDGSGVQHGAGALPDSSVAGAAGLHGWAARGARLAAAIAGVCCVSAASMWTLARVSRRRPVAARRQTGPTASTPAGRGESAAQVLPASLTSRSLSSPPVTWERSEAADRRVMATLYAVEQALAAAGWRSRAAAATTQPAQPDGEVRIALALHPAERNIGQLIAEKMRLDQPAWRFKAGERLLAIDAGAQDGPQLDWAPIVPALQSEAADGRWTHYLNLTATRGLVVAGDSAELVWHGLLAELACVHPPTRLGLSALGGQSAEHYRAAPHWVEPPGPPHAAVAALLELLHTQRVAAAIRPLLLAVIEPDADLLRALAGLARALHRPDAPPVFVLVAASRWSPQLRALATLLPALELRSPLEQMGAELHVAERRFEGVVPRMAAGDVGELLRWLPRFGAALPPTIWDRAGSAGPGDLSQPT